MRYATTLEEFNVQSEIIKKKNHFNSLSSITSRGFPHISNQFAYIEQHMHTHTRENVQRKVVRLESLTLT